MPLSDEVGAVKMGGLMITAPIVRLTRVPDDSNRYSHAIRINDILFFFSICRSRRGSAYSK